MATNNIAEVLARNGLEQADLDDAVFDLTPSHTAGGTCRVLKTVARLREKAAWAIDTSVPMTIEQAQEARAALADMGAILAEVLR